MAALLTNLKEIGEKSIGTPVCDVVISVPGWFSETSRQAMVDAAGIAGLNCLRAMNEHAAVALDYGIYRSNSFDAEKASRVAFVGIGTALFRTVTLFDSVASIIELCLFILILFCSNQIFSNILIQ